MVNENRPQHPQHGNQAQPEPAVLENIARALNGLRFGSIEIVVHEGRVTQIERKEKFRIN